VPTAQTVMVHQRVQKPSVNVTERSYLKSTVFAARCKQVSCRTEAETVDGSLVLISRLTSNEALEGFEVVQSDYGMVGAHEHVVA